MLSLSHSPVLRSPPRPHAIHSPQPLNPGKKKKKKRGSSKIQKHMWLAIKLHMHSVYPYLPPSIPRTPRSHPLQPPTHTSTYKEEKSHTWEDVENNGTRRKQHQATIWAVCGGEQKQSRFGGLMVGQWRQSARRWLQATIPARAQNNAYPVAWWGSAVQ